MTQAQPLKPREVQVINRAIWARGMVPNGHYLCSPSERAAARRMIERGFLSKADRKGDVTFGSPDEWLVIALTPENVKSLKVTFPELANE